MTLLKRPRWLTRTPKPDAAITVYPTAAQDRACDSEQPCQGITEGDVYERRSTPPRSTGNPDKHWDHRHTCAECVVADGREMPS